MAYITRNGTTVLHPRAAHMTMIYEQRGAVEYFVYKRFSEHNLIAEDGDKLLAYPVDAGPHKCLEGHAHVLNLTNGTNGIVDYETMCHSIKPVERHLTVA